MDALDLLALPGHLKIVGTAINMVRRHWRRLFPVVLGAFLLHVALTALLVNLACRTAVINLDSMLLFYEIDDNSTAPAADTAAMAMAVVGAEDEGTRITPLWKLHLTGEFFWRSSFVITMVLLSRACRPEDYQASPKIAVADHGGAAQGIPRASTWRVWMSWAACWVVLSFIADAVVFLTLKALDVSFKKDEALDDLDLEGSLFELADCFGCVYLLAAIVSSEGGINGLSAIKKAWQFVAQNFKDTSLLAITCWLLLQAQMSVLQMVISQYESEEDEGSAAVIDEDTAADILEFSLIAASMAVTTQTFLCSALLAFYRQINEQPRQQINGQAHQN